MMNPSPSDFDTLDTNQSRKIPWLRWAGTLLALGLLVYLIFNEGLDALLQSLKQISWGSLLLVLALTLISRLATVGRWHTLLRSADVKISLLQSTRLVFAGLFAANFLPTTIGGDLIRFVGTLRLKLDGATCAASLVMDRLVGMAGMATILPAGLLRFFNMPFPQNTTSHPLMMVALPNWAEWVKGKLLKLWQSIKHALRLWISHPKDLFKAYLFTWVHMLATFFSIWYLFGQMGGHISFWLIAGLWSMTYFITLLPVSINGLGVQEVALTFFFVNYAGISSQNMLVIALLMRILPVMASLPGAFFVGSLLQPEKK
jgi:uncharacterized membrane protein YbhN (UPF0104 family)